jgi:acyl-CoA synthetase (AMP-forming)/AMP-acid ligase II
MPQKRAAIDRDGFVTRGDVGYIGEDGYLFLCDRKRDMVISGGVDIYPPRSTPFCTAWPTCRTAPSSAFRTGDSAKP